MPAKLFSTLFFLTTIYFVKCSNILILGTVLAKSHQAIYERLFEELANKGHNITLISFYSRDIPIPNYRVISISTGDNLENRRVPLGPPVNRRLGMWLGVFALAQLADMTCPRLLTQGNVRNFLKENNTFDLILFEAFNTNCDLGIAKKFKAPIIGEYFHLLV